VAEAALYREGVTAPDPAEAHVVMDGVTKRYGDLTVLDELSLHVGRGEKVSLIGPSGSGKSTILRVLMTLEDIDDGEVYLDGEPVFHTIRNGKPMAASEAHLRRMRRKVGMVFQHFHLFPHMSVLRNVTEAPRRVLGLNRKAAEERAVTLLDRVGLGEKADDYPGSLSGGQKQRVAIARALAMEPEIMLFDEVTSALDPELVGDVLEVMIDLAREGGVTMIVVTHQMRFAKQVADRVLFIDEGRIVEEAPPDRMFSAPSSPRTRKFLESILDP